MSETYTNYERDVIFYCYDKSRMYIVIIFVLFSMAFALMAAAIFFLFKTDTIHIAATVSGTAAILLLIQHASKKYKRYAIVWKYHTFELWDRGEVIHKILEEFDKSVNTIAFEDGEALREKTSPTTENNRNKEISPSKYWNAKEHVNGDTSELREFQHTWVHDADDGKKILLNTNYGVPAEYAGKYLPDSPRSAESGKLKYYGDFFYDDSVFTAYIKARSLKEAVQVCEKAGCQPLEITDCDGLTHNVDFSYPWLPYTITTKELKKVFRLSRGQVRTIKSMIEDKIIVGTSEMRNEASLNVRSLIDFCSWKIRESFEALNEQRKASQTTSSYRDALDCDKKAHEKSADATDMEEKLNRIQKLRMAPNVIRVTLDNLYEKCHEVKPFNKAEILRARAGIYIDLFMRDFKSPLIERAYTILSKSIAAGYHGVKLDGHTPGSDCDNVNPTSISDYIYILNNGNLVTDETLVKPEHNDLDNTTKLILTWMRVPADAIEGIFKRRTEIDGKEYEFTIELRLMNYGQSIICQWR